MMALKDIEKKNTKYKYVAVIDDSVFENKKDVILFNKQATTNKVSALISFASSSGHVIAPLAEKHKIIYMNVGASDPIVAKGDYNFIHWTPSEQTAKRVVDFYTKNKYKTVVFLGSVDAGIEKIESQYNQLMKKAGIRSISYYAQPSEKDLRMIIKKSVQNKPDAFMIMFWGGQLPIFVKQYNELGLKIPITNIETFSMAPDFSILGGTLFSDVAQNPPEFNERLRGEYKTTKSDFATGNFYDAVMLIVQAFETAESPENAVYELQKIKKYNGVVGTLTQDDIGVFHSGAVMKQIKNGKPVVVE
jgi:ABC-type branched-subunit amino acid transport system substrate-binding protein